MQDTPSNKDDARIMYDVYMIRDRYLQLQLHQEKQSEIILRDCSPVP